MTNNQLNDQVNKQDILDLAIREHDCLLDRQLYQNADDIQDNLEYIILRYITFFESYYDELIDIIDASYFECEENAEYFRRLKQKDKHTNFFTALVLDLKKNKITPEKYELLKKIYENLEEGIEEEKKKEIDEHTKKLIIKEFVNPAIAKKRIAAMENFIEMGDYDKFDKINEMHPLIELNSIKLPTIHELFAKKHKGNKMLFEPWLRAGETNLVYAQSGVGKSLFTVLISHLLCTYDKKADIEPSIGEWKPKERIEVLYVDGEMGELDLKIWLKSFMNAGLGDYPKDSAGIHVWSAIDRKRDYGESPVDITKKEDQKRIINYVKNHPEIKLVIFDSLFTLGGLKDIKDNSEFINSFKPLSLDLRSMDIASILVHHAGKNGDALGANAQQFLCNNVFELKNHENKAKGEAWFYVKQDGKQRAHGPGTQDFSIRFDSNVYDVYKKYNHKVEKHQEKILAEVETHFYVSDEKAKAKTNLKKNITNKTKWCILSGETDNSIIIRKSGNNRGNLSNIKRELFAYDYMKTNGKLTEIGEIFLKELEELYGEYWDN